MSRERLRVWCPWILVLLLILVTMPVIPAQDDAVPADLQSKMGTVPDDVSGRPAAGLDDPWNSDKFGMLNPVDFGVVAVLQGYIRMIYLPTMTLSPPLLRGQLGSASGGLLDVAVTPDNRTALVSNFGDNRVYYVDISNPAAPFIRRTSAVGFFAEDIAVTPNGKYALVTDGGLASQVAVLDVVTGRVRQRLNLGGLDAQAVAVSPDGQTVLCADWWGGAVHVLTLNSLTGRLTYKNRIDMQPYWPVNISISPDGRTALVGNHQSDDPLEGGSIPVLSIDRGSRVTWTDTIFMPHEIKNAQSVAFTNDGRRAYFIAEEYIGEKTAVDEIFYINRIYELDVLGPGQVELTGRVLPINQYTSGSLFGVDTLAVDPYDRYLFVSNKSTGGAQNALTVVDLWRMVPVKTLRPGAEMDDVPMGVSFVGSSGFLSPAYRKSE
jgi:DNA-binding beta-propeller fold protein YncE